MLKLSLKEANNLIGEIEKNHGNADSLRAAVKDVNNPGNGKTTVPTGSQIEEEFLAEMRAQVEIEHGTDLECVICHEKFDHLLCGTCEVCWREWMLETQPSKKLEKKVRARKAFLRGI